MTRASHADDPEARRLREAIAAELIALRQAFAFRTRMSTMPGGDIAGHVGNVLRSNPAWAAGAAAGALAGVVTAVRSRLRRRNGA
ncbi:MAG TPA: hypothetical protein VJ206_05770 [bacterium]|nr:hypothetical protein [bacterium]